MDFAALREEAWRVNLALPKAGLVRMHGGNANGFTARPAGLDRAALKAAVMVEDAAKTLWLARQLGPVESLPASEIQKWWDRYHTRYGQD